MCQMIICGKCGSKHPAQVWEEMEDQCPECGATSRRKKK